MKKWIGAFAAALGGLDTLVFAGRIGENAPIVRARVCAGLGFLGIELDEMRNTQSAPLISPNAGRVAVRVMHTDEKWMIAKTVLPRSRPRPFERKLNPENDLGPGGHTNDESL